MFRNPCHRCLVKIRCSQTCDTYEKFATRACILIMILSVLLIPFYIFLLYLLHKHLYHDIHLFIYSIFLFWLASAILFEYVLKDKPDTKNSDPLIIFLIAPWYNNIILLAKLTKNYGKRAGNNVPQKLL